MTVPSEILDAIVSAAKAERDPDTHFYLVDCDVKLPDLVLTIGGKKYAIPSKEYVLDVSQFASPLRERVDYWAPQTFLPLPLPSILVGFCGHGHGPPYL